MIISDTHRFVFIHIPKCAGTTVKKQLVQFDERGRRYSKVERHPVLGKLDMTHLQLAVLQTHFTSEYECVKAYNSFALCRDPFERFLSALLQRVMAYEAHRRETISQSELHNEIGNVIDYLGSKETISDHRYIYFEKQSSYVFVEGIQIVDNVFEVHNIAKFYEAVGAYLGCNFDMSFHQNQSLYARNALVRVLIEKLWPTARGILPARVTALRNHIKRCMYRPSRERLGGVLKSREVRDFVETYYAKDLELFNASLRR